MRKLYKIAYSLGALGSAISYQAFSTYFYFFYVDVMKLSVALASIGMMVYGVWNAINDPLAGYLSDRTRTRWGRRKPYILFGFIPMALSFIIIWTPPVNRDMVLFFMYYTFVINLFDTVYTFVILNWTSLFPEMFSELGERAEVSAYRQLFGVVGLIFGIAAPPLIYSTLGWLWMGVFIAVITAITMYISLFGVREKEEFRLDKPLNVKDALTATLHNKSFMTYISGNVGIELTYLLLTASAPFYTKYVLKVGDFETSLFFLAAFLSAIPMLYVWRKITVKYGVKRAYMLSIGSFALLLLPALFAFDFVSGIVVAMLISVGLSGSLLLPDVVISDVIDEDEVRTGVRREGMYFGINAFFIRISIVLQAMIIGSVLSVTGYVPDVIPQSGIVEFGIRSLMSIIPLIILFLSLFFVKEYPLDGQYLQQIKLKLEEMHKMKRAKLMQG
ncbi:MAG: MFS transporter [Thermoprotei archaeon]|jgi:GPH family glycoside/pentoside/hexuronide:cation symporter